jgi:isopenicillin-N N-acyltransferase-like protein
MKRESKALSITLMIALCSMLPITLDACTLWAAIGDKAGGGGTLLSKNRDWKPDHRQTLRLVHPREGFTYLGLFAEGNDDPGLKAGVNEKGLSIVSASTNVPRNARASQPGKHGVMARILAGYASVDALIADAEKILSQARTSFFMVSDRRKVLVAEVGLAGKFSVKVVESGTATHTNHFLDPQLASIYNDKIGTSSAIRLARINELLAQGESPFTLAKFAAISRDQHDGQDNSLWRSGRECTLASWIIESPIAGPQRLCVVIANPREEESTQDFELSEVFWKKKQF